MQKTRCVMAVALAFTATALAGADDKADTRAVIEKAIQARGGEEKLVKVKAVHFTGKGKFYGMGEGIDFTGDWNIQPPDKIRAQINFDANGMKFTFLMVFNGKKGWMKINDDTMEMDEDALVEAREDQHAFRVETLVPLLKDKGFELSPLGEAKVGDQAAVGVRVKHKGHRDINLYFDKKSGLLLKTERMVKDPMMGGMERTQEVVHSDYKDVGGVQHSMKVVIKRDGQKYVDSEVSDFETKDKIDDSIFAKP